MRPQRLEDLQAWTTAKHVARLLHEQLPSAIGCHLLLSERILARSLDCIQNIAATLPPARYGGTWEPGSEIEEAEAAVTELHGLVSLAADLGCIPKELSDKILEELNVLQRQTKRLRRLVDRWQDALFGEEFGCIVDRAENLLPEHLRPRDEDEE